MIDEKLIFDQAALTFEGQMFLKLLDHFAIIAAIPDGEDTTGRQKLRLLTPSEAVNRASDLAIHAHDALLRHRWLVPQLPAQKGSIP